MLLLVALGVMINDNNNNNDKGMKMEGIRLTNHFVERFNQRYMNQNNYQWTDEDLRSYMTMVFKPYQLRHLMRRKNFSDPQYIYFGSKHTLVVRNNSVITIYDSSKLKSRQRRNV